MSMKLFTYPGNYRAWKSLISAAYNDLKIDVPAFEMGKDNQSAEFLEKNPLGKVPVLETPHGSIFESNAIARYVARLRQDTNLYGSCFFESSQVDQWIDFCANELEPTRAIWLFPLLGYMQYDADAYNSAKSDITKALHVLDKHLATRTYLVGHQVTLADIVICCALTELYKRVFDAAFRKPFVNVNRWFTTCVNQPQFFKVMGKVDFADKEEVYQGAGAAKQDKKKDNKKEDKPAAAAKKDDKPAAAKKEDKPAKGGDDEEESFEEKKGPNPLDALAKSSMNLDATKKLFFEKRPNFGDFFTEFWKFFDANGYCLYFLDYNYNSENTVYFMSCNLMGGFIQRLDELRKYGFGVVNLCGKDEETGPYPVNACFIFRGLEVPAEMKGCPDSEYYTFSKVDHTNADHRKKVEDRFYAATIDGLSVLDRRYFK